MTTDLQLGGKSIPELPADELDRHIQVALVTKDKPALHLLVEERLHRNEVISGASRRLCLLRQAFDLDLINSNETWREGHAETFFDYLRHRRLEYEQRGYDAESDLLCVKGYGTVMSWLNIVLHYHHRHAMPLEQLAGIPKGKLEVASGACNLYDATHEDEMDAELRHLLLDDSVTADTLLERYYAGKEEAPALEGAEIEGDAGAEVGGDDGQVADGGEDFAADVPDPADEELDIVLNTETGELTAWVNHGRGALPVALGLLRVKDSNAHPLIINLCQSWGIRFA